VKDEAQATPDPDLDRIVGLAQVVRAQIEAETHAKEGRYDLAAGVMDGVSQNIGARGLGDLVIAAQSIGSKVSNHANYVSSTSYRAGFSRGATRGLGGTYGSAVAADLGNLGVALSNSSQALVSSSFEVEPDMQVQIGDPDPDMQVQIGDAPPWGSVTTPSNNWVITDMPVAEFDQDQLDALQKAIQEAQEASQPPADPDPEPAGKINQKPSRW
jgi:hypothetical protein